MSKLRIDTGRPFRFPFDIDRRVFLALAAFFFILSIKPINKLIFPRLTSKVISQKINKNYEARYKKFEEFTTFLKPRDLSFLTINPEKLNQLNNSDWSVLIYEGDSLLLYSQTLSDKIPENIITDSIYTYLENGVKGVVIQKEKTIDGRNIRIIGKFPLFKEYKSNKFFFKSHFIFSSEYNEPLEDFGYTLEMVNNLKDFRKDADFVYINDIPRFNLVEKSNFLDLTDKNFWRFFLAAVPFILFGVSIHTFFKVSVKRNPLLYFSLLLITAIGLRTLGYLFHFPDDYNEFYLFNPSLYASGGLNISLGDVFINVCLMFWFLFFFVMNVQNKVWRIRTEYNRIIFLVILSIVLAASGYVTLSGIKSIVFDSLISFDTTNYVNLTAPLIFGMGTVLLMFMNYVLITLIYNRYFDRYTKRNWIKFIPPLIFIGLAFFVREQQMVLPIIYACLWTLILLQFLSSNYLYSRFDFNSYKLIYWLIFLASSCVLIIHYFETNKEIKLRQNLASNLIRFENKHTENLLKELDDSLRQDPFIINSKDIGQDFGDYLHSKYLTRFETEYQSFSVVTNDSNSAFSIESQNVAQAIMGEHVTKDIAYPLYLINNPGSEQYILFVPLPDKKIAITLRPKYFNLDYPKASSLTAQYDPNKSLLNTNYQLAFYEDDQLVSQSSTEDFPIRLSKYTARNEGVIKYRNGYSDIIAHAKSNNRKKSVIIRKKENVIYKLSTTYAYLFSSIFLLITLYILGNIIARSNLRLKRILNLLGLTLRMRIHLSILLVELISLTIIGLVTIVILSNNSKNTALLNASMASKDIKNVIQHLNLLKNDSLLSADQLKKSNFAKSISPYLEKHNVELNLYTLAGKRIFTTVSQNLSMALPNLINPNARLELLKNGNTASKQNQEIGKLKYYTIYSYLLNNRNDKIGILEIPNFSSLETIKQNNSDIITVLINIYAFIFLLSSMFAFYITKRLTYSFSRIITQFSKINLTQTNQPLSWPYSDEIGLLIKEYNRTLRKLENSTALLAKSERELAWREMAKQIAHEIKNPLTPMSLSLQSLQMAIKRKDPNLTALTEKMTTTVLEQIKVLTRTATNFSEFAKMSDVDARKESLIDILESTTGIYSDGEELEFLFVLPKKDIFVRVDKVKLIRVITNVIQNSVQSIPSDRIGQIVLMVTKEANNMVKVTIQDNGHGIPEENYDKVFIPNFTTKSSGSGLGLAMCKDIMTKTGGNIYFESEEGVGSKFHIEIPLFKESGDYEEDKEFDDAEDEY